MKKGWEIKRLGQVCQIIAGQSPEGKFYNNIGNGIPFYQGKKEFNGKYIGAPTTWTTQSTKIAIKDDILMSVRAPVGPVNFSTGTICIGRGLAAIRASDVIDKEFLFNFLVKHEKDIIGNEGAVFNSLNKSQIENIEINLPPIPEQKEIIRIIEISFDKIEKAKNNIEKNLKNTKELFESYLQSVFENAGKDCEVKLLNEICEVKDGTHDSPKYISRGIPFVTQKNIREAGLTFDNTKFISVADHNKFYKRSNVTFGDILISMIGANRGMAAIVNDNLVFSIKNVGLIKANNKINIHYLLYFLKSPSAIKYVKEKSNGGAQEFIGLTSLRSFPIPYANLKEQEIIVKKLDALSTNTRKLESIYEKKLKSLEELKKSVLQKAFNGELV